MKISDDWLNFLKFSRNFLAKSQLRSLRNATMLDIKSLRKVLLSMNISVTEQSFLLGYIYECRKGLDMIDSMNFWMYFMSDLGSDEEPDPYRFCYTQYYELTTSGKRIKNETYRAQAQI